MQSYNKIKIKHENIKKKIHKITLSYHNFN